MPRTPGSGKPKGYKSRGTMEKDAAREFTRKYVTARLEAILEAQVHAATGTYQAGYRDEAGRFKVIEDPLELQARDKMGQVIRVFMRLPSTAASVDLLNRALDKPAEHVEVTGADGKPLEVKWLS